MHTRAAANAGFTLLELLVVTSVITLLTVAATPSLIQVWQAASVQRTLHVMSTSMALARIHAVTQGEPTSLCPSRDGASCSGGSDWSAGWIVYRDPQRSPQPRSPVDVIEASPPLQRGISLRSSASRQRVRFNPGGWAPGSNLRLDVCSRNSPRLLGSIVLSNAGRTRVEHHWVEQSCPQEDTSSSYR